MSDEAKSFQDQVTELVNKAQDNGNGALVLTEELLKDLPEPLAVAAKAELRYRNTQSSYTKASQRLKEISTVNEKLVEHLTEQVTIHITPEQRRELDDLKRRDPEAWRAKLNEHESEARRILTEKLQSFEQAGKQMSELEIRAAKVAAFKETTGLEITDDVVDNQLPASYKTRLNEGKITFDEFLELAGKFLSGQVTIKGAKDTPAKDVDFKKLPGGSKPDDKAIESDIVTAYKNTVF